MLKGTASPSFISGTGKTAMLTQHICLMQSGVMPLHGIIGEPSLMLPANIVMPHGMATGDAPGASCAARASWLVVPPTKAKTIRNTRRWRATETTKRV